MTVYKQCDIKCDECLSWYDNPWPTVAYVRHEAKDDGWKFSKGRDICPDCQEEA
jgi:hypothetical protein